VAKEILKMLQTKMKGDLK